MSRIVGKYAHPLDTDADARGFLEVVAAAVPGACKTYARIGAGEDPDAMQPQDSPDHDACVQRDLGRKDGPGAAYGQGLFRAAAGALALWKAELAALHEGAAQMDGRFKDAFDRRLSVVDEATPKIVPKVVAAQPRVTCGRRPGTSTTPPSPATPVAERTSPLPRNRRRF